jgi:hypothetical protein
MSEVQAHGNKFEDIIIRQRTGLSKKEYDKLKKKGYTSPFDLTKGLFVDYDSSVKTTQNNTICCSDLLNMMSHIEEYRLIVGCYDQVENKKVFHTQYEFFIEPQHYDMLWNGMDRVKIEEYVSKIKSIEKGKEAQLQYQQFFKESWKSEVSSDTSLFMINPKVDSKKQRRVQCSTNLDKLIDSGIGYTKEDINIIIQSKRRKLKQ